MQGHAAVDGEAAQPHRGHHHHLHRDPCVACVRLHPRRDRARPSALQAAVREAYDKGYLGRDILGSGHDIDLVVHTGRRCVHLRRGDGVAGLARGPTRAAATAPSVPCRRWSLRESDRHQQRRVDRERAVHLPQGADWFASMGTEKSKGMTLYSLSGHVAGPGQYEAPLGITLRELLDMSGGMRDGRELKFWTPGGSSTPMLTAEHLDVPMDYEAIVAAGSMLGTKALQMLRRDDVGRAHGAAMDGVLRPRVLRQVHPMSRRHVLAGPDPAPAGSRRRALRPTSTPWSTSATTFSAGRSAHSVTVRRARSRRRSSTSVTSSSRAHTPRRGSCSRTSDLRCSQTA